MHGELPRRVLSRELAIPALDFIFFPGTTQKSGIGQEDGAKTDTNIFRCLPFSRKFPRSSWYQFYTMTRGTTKFVFREGLAHFL